MSEFYEQNTACVKFFFAMCSDTLQTVQFKKLDAVNGTLYCYVCNVYGYEKLNYTVFAVKTILRTRFHNCARVRSYGGNFVCITHISFPLLLPLRSS